MDEVRQTKLEIGEWVRTTPLVSGETKDGGIKTLEFFFDLTFQEANYRVRKDGLTIWEKRKQYDEAIKKYNEI